MRAKAAFRRYPQNPVGNASLESFDEINAGFYIVLTPRAMRAYQRRAGCDSNQDRWSTHTSAKFSLSVGSNRLLIESLVKSNLTT